MMRRIRVLLGAIAFLAGASVAHGATQELHKTTIPSSTTGTVLPTTYLASTALNGSAASRTFTINNPGGGYAYANLELARTRVAGTDLTMTCVSTMGTGTPAAVRGVCTYDATGVCTHLTATRKSATSSTETLAWVVNILGWRRTDCTVASTGAGGTDLIVVSGGMVTR